MPANMSPDAIGVEYRIDLNKLRSDVAMAKRELSTFNQWITASTKKIGKMKIGITPEATKTISNASSELRKMGISSGTTAGEIKKLNLSALDMNRVFELTKKRMGDLKTSMTGTSRASRVAAKEYKQLERRLPVLEHEANKGVKAFGDYRRAMDRWSGGFKYMMLSQAAWVASGAVLFGTLAAIGKGFKDIIEYHQGMKGLEAITGATAEEMEVMADAINGAAVATKFFAGDMTKAATVMGQAGFSAKEISSAIGGIALLASASNRSLEDTADLMTTVIRAYEMSANESLRVANILAAGIVNSKLQIEDLRTAFNYMGVAAHQFNLSLEDTVGWLGILRDRGLKASTIGTSFRMVLASLVRDTKKFRDVLKSLDDPLGFADVTIRNGRKVEESMKRLAKAGFNVADAFVALPQRTAMTFSLMVQNVDVFEKMRSKITDTNTAIEMNITQMEGQEYQLKQIRSIFFEVIRSMSRSGGAFDPFIKALKYLLKVFGSAGIVISAFFNMVMKSISGAIAALVTITSKLKIPKITSETVETGETDFMGEPILRKEFGISGIFGNKDETKAALAEISGVYEGFYSDISKTFEDMLKDEMRILNPDIRTKAEKKIEESKEKLSGLYEKQKTLQDQFAGIGEKGSAEWNKIRDALVQVNAQIRMIEAESGLFKDKIVGPVSTLKDIMLDAVVGPDMKADDLLSYFRAGKDSIELMENAVKQLRDKYYSEAFPGWQVVLSKDTEEYKRMLDLAEKLVEAEKALTVLKERQLSDILKSEREKEKARKAQLKLEMASAKGVDKRLKDEIKMWADRLKQSAKFEKEGESIDKKANNFKEKIIKKTADLESSEYEREVAQWKSNVEMRKRDYDDLLAVAQEHYENMFYLEEENPLLIGQLEKAEQLIEKIKAQKPGLSEIDKKERREIKDPKDFEQGMKDGFKDARKTLENEYGQWKSLTNATAIGMRDTFSDVFFDSMTHQLKSLGDYWKMFGNTVKREIANMAASWVTSGLFGKSGGSGGIFGTVMAGVSSIFTPTKHDGGWIGSLHGGGSPLKSNESLNILKENEYVIQDTSARALGGKALDYMNATGKVPAAQSVVKNYNSYSIYAMDSESMDQALRRGGAKAISEISMGNYAREKGRGNPLTKRF